MISIGWILIATPVLLVAYAYIGYPACLWLIAQFKTRQAVKEPREWPTVTISLPVYNESAQIREVIESLLRIDYPRARLRILVISDASTDGTDEIVEEYAPAGIQLLRMPQRLGKTAAENAGARHLESEITVNTDASIRIRPDALKKLVAHFNDPTVGVASGRDLSVAADGLSDTNLAEAGYVGYEMRVRALETRAGGIIGASGCFYAIRTPLHREPLPDHLSRDFASVLIAREHGYRAVSVDEAICLVPRTSSLTREYRRKVRTMSRGMETLLHKRHLLNPFRYGGFSLKLASHKVCRWLVPWGALVAIIGVDLLATQVPIARYVAGLIVLGLGLAWLGWRWPVNRPMPRVLALCSSMAAAQLATMHATVKALHGDRNAAWEPTRRERVLPGEQSSVSASS